MIGRKFMLLAHHQTAATQSVGYRLKKSDEALPRRRQCSVAVPHQADLALGTEVRERDVNDFGFVSNARHRYDGDAESRGDEALDRGDLGDLEHDVGVDAVLSPQFIGELPQTGLAAE